VVHAIVRNTLTSPLHLHGFCDRPGPCEPVIVSPGATHDGRFALKATGTFNYWADTTGSTLDDRGGVDSQLGGAIVVDPAGSEVSDRVFVLGLLDELPNGPGPLLTVINGRSWPNTERLSYRTGDPVRWRVVNLSLVAHPMHLHGFYFGIESSGDGINDTQHPARAAVTERIQPGGTRMFRWVPERPGTWLFHCHMVGHHVVDDSGGGHGHPPYSAAVGMQGLVLGIQVTGESPAAETRSDRDRRKLQLVVAPDTRHGRVPSYRVDLVSGPDPAPRVSSRAVPGPIMVLTRGEPVAVEVVNRLAEPTAIHWHGIELESQYDGVPDLSGTPGSVTPPVGPGRSFTALFTPPRAGTFMYHTHWHNRNQLTAGVYGPLIVVEPGQRYDPTRDHLVVIGLDGPYRELPDEPFVVNGESTPSGVELEAGVTHRFRFIGIAADNPNLTVQLLRGFDPIQWTVVAKDGADVPPSQRAPRPARLGVAVGETYDVEVGPMPRTKLWLELRRGDGELIFHWPVRIR
jgi:FtsP/CotA-like multicopper oxidase with cupredoxin domain